MRARVKPIDFADLLPRPHPQQWGWNNGKGLGAIFAGLGMAPVAAAIFGAVTFLLIAWWLITSVLYKPEMDEIPGGRALIREELHKLGPWSTGEIGVGLVFVAAALSWSLLPTLIKDGPISHVTPATRQAICHPGKRNLTAIREG